MTWFRKDYCAFVYVHGIKACKDMARDTKDRYLTGQGFRQLSERENDYSSQVTKPKSACRIIYKKTKTEEAVW